MSVRGCGEWRRMFKKDVVRRMRRRMVGDGLKLGWGK